MDQEMPQVDSENGSAKEVISEYDWNEMFKKGKFKKEDMNTLVMDFLVNKLHTNVAETFHTESGCPLGIEDISFIETQKTVKELIYKRQFDEVISLLNQKLGLSFLESNPQVRYLLDQQKMIELYRSGDIYTNVALDFSHEFKMWADFMVNDDDFDKDCFETLLLILSGDDKEVLVDDLLHPWRISWVVVSTLKAMIKFRGREQDHLIGKALKMLKAVEDELNEDVEFPNFYIGSGYPEPLPHPDGPFKNFFQTVDDDYKDC
uniref:protein GID8 homolog n=1 Tax=Erigeron canadensis TaxID=72917 RepID=UPI001CB89765|nr:protein GID8 homolog [Erigeron canadensis]